MTPDLFATLRGVDGPMLLALAGSNGAGKSTFQRRYLQGLGWPFVNADEIGKALARAPDDAAGAREAAALAGAMRADLIARRRSFAMETVFSDPVGAKLEELVRAQTDGFTVVLVFIGLDSPDLSALRVRERVVDEAGRDVPLDRIRARYPRTLANLANALRVIAHVVVLDNSSIDAPYRPVARWERGQAVWESSVLPNWYTGLHASS